MESFKIENFLRANPGSAPPAHASLTDSEAAELGEKLLLQAGQPKGTLQETVRGLSDQATLLPDVDLDHDEVPLQALLSSSGINPGPVLYVHWGRPSGIDRFQTVELDRYFYDVWYPSADDIEIFDDTLAWVMFVRHYGGVEVWHTR